MPKAKGIIDNLDTMLTTCSKMHEEGLLTHSEYIAQILNYTSVAQVNMLNHCRTRQAWFSEEVAILKGGQF